MQWYNSILVKLGFFVSTQIPLMSARYGSAARLRERLQPPMWVELENKDAAVSFRSRLRLDRDDRVAVFRPSTAIPRHAVVVVLLKSLHLACVPFHRRTKD